MDKASVMDSKRLMWMQADEAREMLGGDEELGLAQELSFALNVPDSTPDDLKRAAARRASNLLGVPDATGDGRWWQRDKRRVQSGAEQLAMLRNLVQQGSIWDVAASDELKEFDAADFGRRLEMARQREGVLDGGWRKLKEGIFNRGYGLDPRQDLMQGAPDDVVAANARLREDAEARRAYNKAQTAESGPYQERRSREEVDGDRELMDKWHKERDEKRLVSAYGQRLFEEHFALVWARLAPTLSNEARGIAERGLREQKLRGEDVGKFAQLEEEEQAVVARLLRLSRDKVEGGFWNTLGDAGVGFVNGVVSLPGNVLKQIEKKAQAVDQAVFGRLSGVEDIEAKNRQARMEQRLYEALGDMPGLDGSGAEHGYIARSVIGAVSTLPYMGYAAIPYVGLGMVALDFGERLDEQIALEGGDVYGRGLEWEAFKLVMGGVYAVTERLQADRIFGAATDMQLRVALATFGKEGAVGAGKKIAKAMVVDTAVESFQEALQQGVESVALSVGMGRGVDWREAAKAAMDEFKESLGTMGILSAVGMGRRMHYEKSEKGRTALIEDAQRMMHKKSFLLSENPYTNAGDYGAAQGAELRIDNRIAQLRKVWLDGGAAALVAQGLSAQQADLMGGVFGAEGVAREMGDIVRARNAELMDQGAGDGGQGAGEQGTGDRDQGKPAAGKLLQQVVEIVMGDAAGAKGRLLELGFNEVAAERLAAWGRGLAGSVERMESVREMMREELGRQWEGMDAEKKGRLQDEMMEELGGVDGLRRVYQRAGSQAGARAAMERLGFDKKQAEKLVTMLANEHLFATSREAATAFRALYVAQSADMKLAARLQRLTGWEQSVDEDGGIRLRRRGADGQMLADVRLSQVEQVEIDLGNEQAGRTGEAVEAATGGVVTAEMWRGMSREQRADAVVRLGLQGRGGWVLQSGERGESGQGASEQQGRVLTGEIVMQEGGASSTLYHEATHAWAAMMRQAGLLSEADIKKLQEHYGKSATDTGWFNEEALADDIRDIGAAGDYRPEQGLARRFVDGVRGLLGRARAQEAAQVRAEGARRALFESIVYGGAWEGVAEFAAEGNQGKQGVDKQGTGDRGQETGEQGTGDRGQETGEQGADKQGTGDRGQETGEQGTGDRDQGRAAAGREIKRDKQGRVKWTAATPQGGVRVGGYWMVAPRSQFISDTDVERYDFSLQGRTRDATQGSAAQVAGIAAEGAFDALRLIESADTATGAPIVVPVMMKDKQGKDETFYMVLSGNGRFRALDMVDGDNRGDAYRGPVKQWADEMGVGYDKDVMTAEGQPRLVRVLTQRPVGVTYQRVAELSNQNTVLQMTEAEQAGADAALIKRDGMAEAYSTNKDGMPSKSGSDRFFAWFVNATGDGSLVDSKGDITGKARERARRAMLALAIGQGELGKQVVQVFTERAEEMGLERQADALLMAAGRLLTLGELKPEYALDGELSRAAQVVMEMVREQQAGKKIGGVDEVLAQGDMLDRLSEVTEELVRLLASDRKAEWMAEALRRYAELAERIDTTTQDMFGEENASKAELLKRAVEQTAKDEVRYSIAAREVESWNGALTRYELGQLDKREDVKVLERVPVVLGRVLEGMGVEVAEGMPIVVSPVALDKITGRFIYSERGQRNVHGVSVDELRKVVEEIDNPIAVFESETRPDDSLTVLVQVVDSDTGMPSIMAVDYMAKVGRDSAMRITSVYSKPVGAVQGWLDRGLTKYVNTKKAAQAFRQIRLQLPAAGMHGRDSLLTENDFRSEQLGMIRDVGGDVNRDIRYSLEAARREGAARAAEEYRAVEAQWKREDGSYREGWLKAPNGADTRLNERQWVQVRTPSFKEWFGDWEGDPQNASQVVDENGEPLVVYHGTAAEENFSVFDPDRGGINFGREEYDRGYIFFTSYAENADPTGFDDSRNTEAPRIYPVFLNIRNALALDAPQREGASWSKMFWFQPSVYWDENVTKFTNEMYSEDNDGAIVKGENYDGTSESMFVVMSSNQIKSATGNTGAFSGADVDIRYSLEAARREGAARAAEEYRAVEAQWKREDGSYREGWLKAPNGADTRLNERQWVQVRTPSFKEWFGDWEGDPQNASQVVDENGEPLVVAHSTDRQFTEFANMQENDAGWLGAGYYFFGDRSLDGQYGRNVMDVFLNIRDPHYAAESDMAKLSELDSRDASSEFSDSLVGDGHDGVYYNGNLNQEWVAFNPEQIKSATGNTGAFSGADVDIRYSLEAARGEVADAAYMAAVKRGDMEAAQEMVDAAIKRAGYDGWGRLRTLQGEATDRREDWLQRLEAGQRLKEETGRNALFNMDGTVILYHGSSPENISSIQQTGLNRQSYLAGRKQDVAEHIHQHAQKEIVRIVADARDIEYSSGSNEFYAPNGLFAGEDGVWSAPERAGEKGRVKLSAPVTYDDEGMVIPLSQRFDRGNRDIRYSLVSNTELLHRLENEETIKVYRAMQVIDGKLYPPMAAKVGGKLVPPIELGKWEQADEMPDLVKDGKFKLDKANGSAISARYNPYFHTSRTPLNDQFSSAWRRPNLVTVEVEVPVSELSSGYKAEGAKDAVGEMSWHNGPVSSKLPTGKTRRVILTRYDKPVRIVPDAEVAARVAHMLVGEDIVIPANVITPSLRGELEKLGVAIQDRAAQDRKQEERQRLDGQGPEVRYALDARGVAYDREYLLTAHMAHAMLTGAPVPSERTMARLAESVGMASIQYEQMARSARRMAQETTDRAILAAAQSADPNMAAFAIGEMARQEQERLVREGAKAGSELARVGERRSALSLAEQMRAMRDMTGADMADIEADIDADLAQTLLLADPEKFAPDEKREIGDRGQETGEGKQDKEAEQGQGQGEMDEDAPELTDKQRAEIARKRRAREQRIAEMLEQAKARGDRQRAAALERQKRRMEEAAGVEAAGVDVEGGEGAGSGGADALAGVELGGEQVPLNLTDKWEAAALMRVWAFDRWKRDNPLRQGDGKDVSKDKVAVEFYRKTVTRTLKGLARKLLAPGFAREVVLGHIEKIEVGQTANVIERNTAYIFGLLNKHAIREERKSLVQKFRNEIKRQFVKGLKFEELGLDLDRVIRGQVEEDARYVLRVCELSNEIYRKDISISGLQREHDRLQAIVEGRLGMVDEQGNKLEVGDDDMQLRQALRRLALLDKYGGMVNMMPGEILDLQGEALANFGQEAVALAERWRAMDEVVASIRDPLARAIMRGMDTPQVDDPGALGRLTDSLMGMLRQRLDYLTRYEADARKREAAREAINSIMNMLADGSTEYSTTLNRDQAALAMALAEIHKGNRAAMRKYLRSLDERIPVELARQLSKQGHQNKMTKGQMLQLLAYLDQWASYGDNIKKHGRAGQAALIRNYMYEDAKTGEIRRVFTAEDAQLLEWLRREHYAGKRGAISEVTMRIAGREVESPDPLYMPIRVHREGTRGLSNMEGGAWQPLSGVFSRRVKHGLDVDESASILDMFYDRTRETALLLAYTERGIILREVLTSRQFQDAVRRWHGGVQLNRIMSQVTQALNGGRKPGELHDPASQTAMRVMTYTALGWNFLTPMKQTTSLPVWANRIGFKNFFKHLANIDWGAVKELLARPEAALRWGVGPESGMSPAEQAAYSGPMDSRAKKFFGDGGLWLNRKADQLVSLWIAQGVYRDLAAQYMDRGMSEAAAKERAASEAFSLIEETQSSTRAENLPLIRREGGVLGKLVTQFAITPLLQIQYEIGALREWSDLVKNGGPEANIKEARNRYVRALLLNHVIVPAAILAATNLYQALTGDEPEWKRDGYWQTILVAILMGQFSRVFFAGAFAESTLNAFFKREMPRAGQLIPAEGVISFGAHLAYPVRDIVTWDMDHFEKDLKRAAKGTAVTRLPVKLYENYVEE